MGLLSALTRLVFASHRVSRADATADESHRCRFEPLEPRQLLAADLHLGSVYFEEATGDDSEADVIEIAFVGGAAGTQLTQVTIDGDKKGNGRLEGDVFFDTADGGLGAFQSVGLNLISHEGFEVSGVTVVDGGSQIVFDLVGFDAGEKLVFSVDADEISFIETDGTVSATSVVEGGEFERSRLSGVFEAPHYESIQLDATYWDAFNDDFDAAAVAAASRLDLPADAYSTTDDLSDRTAGAVVTGEQVPLPIVISGSVYVDNNLNVGQDPGETGIAGVQLELWVQDDVSGSLVNTGKIAITDGDGNYEFNNNATAILPGRYEIRESQPAGYFSVGASPGTVNGAVIGTVIDVDTLGDIDLLGGQHSRDNDFAEALPASLSGYVYHDADDDGSRDPGEEGITAVVVNVVPVDTIDGSSATIATLTDADGFWSVTGLAPGEYRVVEPDQPQNYLDGLDSAGTVLGVTVGAAVNPGDVIEAVVLAGGQSGVEYNFGELLPGSISGHIHASTDGDCESPEGELPLAGVAVDLLDASGTLIDSTVTDSNGNYRFDNLAPGEYQIVEHQPEGYYDGDEHVGSAGGILGNDRISQIVLGSGTQAVNYDFCEHVGVNLSGWVYHDASNDGLFDAGETGIGGVTLRLLDASGNATGRTTTTDSSGYYQFTNLEAGTYGVAEVQPAGYLDGLDTPGDHGGVAENPGDRILGAVLVFGQDASEYNFGELLPGSISGHIHASTDGDCESPEGELPLAGVAVDLLDASGTLIDSTVTDSNGNYRFDNLAPGEYQIVEHQPEGYYDGDEHVGSAGGILGNDRISQIVLGSGTQAVNYDFCEHVGVNLSGWVYHDASNDGLFDAGETGIGGVTLRLLDASGNATGRTTTTDSSGYYQFTNLEAGTYGVAEVQPAGYLDGLDTPGDHGGVAENPGDRILGAVLVFGQDASEYNFGELLPGSISGFVHVDNDGNCIFNDQEQPIAGTVIELYNDRQELIATTTSNEDGRYEFNGLPPGIYAVRERQPDGFFHGGEIVGSGGGIVLGSDRLGQIEVGSGARLVDYNFCEVAPASLSGYVFQDGPAITTSDGNPPESLIGLRDGRRTSDDAPIAGVTVELRHGVTGAPITGDTTLAGTYGEGPIRTVTDASGFYEFRGLRAGVYAVYQVHPNAYFDAIDTPGSTGGVAINPQLGDGDSKDVDLSNAPVSDVIYAIPLAAGQQSVENNFSEIAVREAETPFFPPIPVPETPEFFIAPEIVQPFNPALEPRRFFFPEPVPFVGGSFIDLGFSWHLSIIDAGQPRLQRMSPAMLRLTGTTAESVSWTSDPGEQALWSLLQVDQEANEDRRTALFGNPRAIPVTGDFNGDGITDLGVFLDGEWFIDVNGNGTWDEGDLWAKLGEEGDTPVTGDWDGDGKIDIGIFGPLWPGDPRAIEQEMGLPDPDNQRTGRWKNVPPSERDAAHGIRTMKLTSRGSLRTDVIDHVFRYGEAGDIPITGDWNGDGIDTIGVVRNGVWHLDTNGDGRLTADDQRVSFGRAGDVPVVGDWDGDGVDSPGVYSDGAWIMDTNGDRVLTAHDRVFQSEGTGMPVAGDWDGDGVDEPGFFHGGPDAGPAAAPAE